MGQIAKPIDQVVGWIGNLLANFLAQPLGVNKK
jgi:hypothetical protein